MNSHCCEEITIIIPMYNEERRLEYSFTHWERHGLIDRFQMILADDGSYDGTSELVQRLISRYPNCKLFKNTQHKSKLSTIKEALALVNTPYVLCLDADAWFDGQPDELLLELRELMATGVDGAAFRLLPCAPKGTLIIDLQAAEYSFFCDVARKLFGIVGNINGAAAFWRTKVLQEILSHHSLIFEGDDLEATLIAHDLHANIKYSPLCFRKLAKPSLAALIRQRMRIWDVGLFGAFMRKKPITLPRSSESLFFKWYALFEALLHPLKVLSLLILLISFPPIGLYASFVPPISKVLLWVYLLVLCFCFILWLRSFTYLNSPFRLLFLLTIFSIVPSINLFLILKKLNYLFYFIWWCTISIFYSLFISDRVIRKRSICIAAVMPFYFLFFTVVVRTGGFFFWLRDILKSVNLFDSLLVRNKKKEQPRKRSPMSQKREVRN